MASDLPRQRWSGAASGAQAQIPERNARDDCAADSNLAALKAVLEASRHNVSEAARRLGIHRSTPYRRLGRTSH